MEQFLEFVNRKQRESKRHLSLVERLLKQNGLHVASHLEDENPFVFVKSPSKLSFDGVRVYEIGDMIAYRVQREEKTEPFGRAYILDLEEMFNDYMGENDMEEQEAGRKVIEGVVEELRKFFERTAKAEDDLRSAGPEGELMVRTGGTDYGAMVLSKS